MHASPKTSVVEIVGNQAVKRYSVIDLGKTPLCCVFTMKKYVTESSRARSELCMITQSQTPMAVVTVKISTQDQCELCEFAHNDQSTEAKTLRRDSNRKNVRATR